MVDTVDFMIAAGLNGSAHHTPINKFGYNTAVGTSFESITDLGTFNLPSTAAAVSVVSSSGNDTSAGTGARTVEIQGLDANYVEQTATVTMDGTNAVTTGSTTFIRVFRMKVVTAGSNETNVGNITASIGGSDVAQIKADNGQTLMAVYTVPANKVAYLIKFQASISKNQEATIQLRTKGISDNGVWQVKGQFGTFANTIEYNYAVPLVITEKTDIEFRAKAGATSEMGVVFDLVLNG
jgi:hypothetical protein